MNHLLAFLVTLLATLAMHKAGPPIYQIMTSSARNRLHMVSTHLQTRSNHTLQTGAKYTSAFKVYYKNPETGKVGLWFHDVPLNLDTKTRVVNMVVEIPRWTNAKMEISKEERLNPILQDTKKGKLRFVNNIFPFHGYVHNYGAIPQTWEDNTKANPDVENLVGDNDPVDVCDLGAPEVVLGDIIQVKIIGALALIDDGELDWKIIGINVKDPRAEKLNSLKDVEKELPGVLDATRNWFRDYKIPTGKPANEFAFGGKYLDAEAAVDVVLETHKTWKELVSGNVQGKKLPLVVNTSLKETKGYTEEVEIKGGVFEDAEIPSEVNEVFYLK